MRFSWIRGLMGLSLMALAGGSWAQLQLRNIVPVGTTISLPVAMIQHPGLPNTMLIIQQRGKIRPITYNPGTDTYSVGADFLDLTGTVSVSGDERGLLGLAFHPGFLDPLSPGYLKFYVNYTREQTGQDPTTIVEYSCATTTSLTAVNSPRNVMSIAQDFTNHNGGTLRFGSDGFLYIGMGDGGDANDPNNRAQTFTTYLGKMLRINPIGDAFPADTANNYTVPAGNPFPTQGPASNPGAMWSIGIRNPWKFSFDNWNLGGNGAMLIADVGQDAWEEINYEPVGVSGRNYGWRQYEGFSVNSLGPGPASSIPRTDPFHVYSHSVGFAITGGYVYRGITLGDFYGRYFFGEYVNGRMWSTLLRYNVGGTVDPTQGGDVVEHTSDMAFPSVPLVTTIDEDAQGELYVADRNGPIYKILPQNRIWQTSLSVDSAAGLSTTSPRPTQSRDDKVVTMFNRTPIAPTGRNKFPGVIFNMSTDRTSLTTTNLELECRANIPGVVVQVQFYYWGTGQYVNVASYNISTTDALFTTNNISSSAYINASKQVRARLVPMYPITREYKNATFSVDGLKVTPN